MFTATFAIPPFRPHRLLRNAHLQTVLGAYLNPAHAAADAKHEVLLPDGDRFLLHEDTPATWSSGDRVVILVHGLGGCHRSGYMTRIVRKLNDRGVRTYRKELRGFGEGYHLARYHCHAGRSEDIAETVAFVREQSPGSPITLMGFSLGGNMVLKYAGECEDLAPAPLDSVFAANPPIDLIRCCENLRRPQNRIYDWSFVRGLKTLLHKRRRVVPGLHDLPHVRLPRRLREFDDQFTAPLVGFSGYGEYYEKASAGPVLKQIRVATLILSSRDDPVIPPDIFERHALSSHVRVHVAEGGGHLGFLSDRGDDPDWRWLDWRAIDFVQSLPRRATPAAAERPAALPGTSASSSSSSAEVSAISTYSQ